MSNPLNIVSIHRNLRAAKIHTTHSEGIRGCFVVIREGDKEMSIDANDFSEMAKRLETVASSDNECRFGEWDF